MNTNNTRPDLQYSYKNVTKTKMKQSMLSGRTCNTEIDTLTNTQIQEKRFILMELAQLAFTTHL